MDKDAMTRERARLQMILKHMDEDTQARGDEFAPATRESLERRIAEFDRQIGDGGNA